MTFVLLAENIFLMTKYINDENNIICDENMIDQNVMRVLNDHSLNRTGYLAYINNLDTIYDIELVSTLYATMKLQKNNLEMMMNLLNAHKEYLNTLTFTIKIIVEKYYTNNEKEYEYYVYPQITPQIPDGDKSTFSKAGMWFKDENIAMAFAEVLKNTYTQCEIIKTLV